MSKKEDNRLGRKRERQSVRQALAGGNPKQPLTDNWSGWPLSHVPLEHEDQQKIVKKKAKPKKAKLCPETGKRHRFMRDTKTERVTFITGNVYKADVTFKLCVDCGLEKTVRTKVHWK